MISDKQWHRRKFLRTTAAGLGVLAAGPVLSKSSGRFIRAGKRGPAARSMPFNTGWHFGGEYKSGSEQPIYNDQAFEEVTLPHTVTKLSWQKWDPESWQKVWIYRRHFKLEKEDTEGMRVFLEIGAAMTAATLTLNGQKLGEHFGGYLPLHYELTDNLKDGENILSVILEARFDINVPPDKPGKSPLSVDFWQPGGLYRTASLHIVPQVFLKDVFAKPVNVLDNNRTVEIECLLDAAIVPKGRLKVKAALYDGEKKLTEVTAPVKLTEAGQKTIRFVLNNIHDIQLWEPDHPKLYQLVTTLYVDDQSLHDYMLRTGFRDARFTEKGFFLNGKRVQLFGLNRHQFYPYVGGAMPDRVQRKDVEILRKTLNCNMVRCSHYPQSEAFFDACDELGLMAWEEAAGWGGPLGDEEWQQRAIKAVEQMIRRDRNHPSIIIWGARLNETPDDPALYTQTRNLAHKLDSSRQTTGAMVGGKHDTKAFVQDVFSYNDYAKHKAADGNFQPDLLPPRKDFPYLVSETVGTLSGPYKYYRRTDPAYMLQAQGEAHARVHDIAAADPAYCGVLVWSGFDYPSGSGNQYNGTKYTGVIDLFRSPKPGAAIYASQIDPKIKAVIAPAFYWDFDPRSLPFKNGKEAMICSNCERLEVYIGGSHYATVIPDRNRFAHLPYPPSFINLNNIDSRLKPDLRIDGYMDNKKIITRSFSSDRAKDQLIVSADDKKLLADGVDATRVVFNIADEYGSIRSYTEGHIKINIKGPGILVGDDHFDFAECGGLAAVWVRTKAAETGTISLTVTHEKYGSKTAIISTISKT